MNIWKLSVLPLQIFYKSNIILKKGLLKVLKNHQSRYNENARLVRSKAGKSTFILKKIFLIKKLLQHNYHHLKPCNKLAQGLQQSHGYDKAQRLLQHGTTVPAKTHNTHTNSFN